MVADTFLPMVDPTYGRPHLRGARHCRDGQPEVPRRHPTLGTLYYWSLFAVLRTAISRVSGVRPPWSRHLAFASSPSTVSVFFHRRRGHIMESRTGTIKATHDFAIPCSSDALLRKLFSLWKQPALRPRKGRTLTAQFRPLVGEGPAFALRRISSRDARKPLGR